MTNEEYIKLEELTRKWDSEVVPNSEDANKKHNAASVILADLKMNPKSAQAGAFDENSNINLPTESNLRRMTGTLPPPRRYEPPKR